MKQISDFSSEEIQEARETVADWWMQNAHAIRTDDEYASHVTESEKDDYLQKELAFAEQIRTGQQDRCFAIWQRIHEALTGECIPLLSR